MDLITPDPVDDSPSPLDVLRDMAIGYGMSALRTLDKLAQSDDTSDAARVAACKELLDRGFGRVPQPIEGQQNAVTVVNVVTGVRGRD